MLVVSSLELYPGSQEERLPEFSPQFPHLSSLSFLHRYPVGGAPWHWHKSVELFYVQSGALTYYTPGQQQVFQAGMGGMVNSNVLHHTALIQPAQETILRLHLFEPSLIAGIPGGTIEQKYILPLLQAPGLELLTLSPEDPAQAKTLRLLRDSLALDETAFGYELRLETLLAQVWLRLLEQVRPALELPAPPRSASSEKVKAMMLYLHDHYPEKLSVADIAAAGFCSERECYRAFRECLRTSPSEYLQTVRLQAACKLLTETDRPITAIAQDCGLGSSSYFGTQFRAAFGCTPTAYRHKWQDLESIRHEPDSFGGPDAL